MTTPRPQRSDRYQQFFHEVIVDVKYLESFNNSQSMSHILNPYQYDEELLKTQDKLREEFWKLAKEILTERQYQVISMLRDGYTQQEIAKTLDVNQSSVAKTLNGNIAYENGVKYYGGLIKKMKKAIGKDPKFQELFDRLNELKEEKY